MIRIAYPTLKEQIYHEILTFPRFQTLTASCLVWWGEVEVWSWFGWFFGMSFVCSFFLFLSERINVFSVALSYCNFLISKLDVIFLLRL